MAHVANAALILASFYLAIRLGQRWVSRRNPANLWYAIGLFFTAAASFCDLLSQLLGHAPLFWYGLYWISASSLVGFLGVGSAFLAHRRFGQIYAFITIGLALWVTVAVFNSLGGLPASLDLRPDLFTKAPNSMIKLPFVLQSALGGIIIFVGALWSAVRFRSMPAVWIAIGAAVFSSGGTVAGWFGNSLGIFYWTQFFGILLLGYGVERSLGPRVGGQGNAGERAAS